MYLIKLIYKGEINIIDNFISNAVKILIEYEIK